jgi:hypothetical protein
MYHFPHRYMSLLHMRMVSRGSSVSIVSSFKLDDRAIQVRSPAEAKDSSSSLCVQTGFGAHPASYPMGTGGPFPGAKARLGKDADHSPPSTAEGPRAFLGTETRGKILRLCRISSLYRPVVQFVSRHYTDWARLARSGVTRSPKY